MRQHLNYSRLSIILLSFLLSSMVMAFPGGEPGWGGGGGGGTPPPPVNAVYVPATNGTGAYSVTWSGGIVYKKEVQRSTNGSSYVLVANINEGIGSWAETGRVDGNYQYRVRTCMDPETGSSLCSSYVYSAVVSVVHVPGTPSSLTVPSTDTNGAYSLSWGSASGVLANFELEESINGGSFNNVSTGPALSKSLSGRVDGNYTYRVRACNVSGCGGYRNGNATLAVRLTPSVPGTPNAPSNSAGNNSVSITWTKPAGTVTSYDVQKRLGSGSWTTAASGVTGTSRIITSLADGSWTFRVRACNSIWSCSSYGASDTSIVRYKPGTPGVINPTTSTNTNSVTVAWNSVTRATYYKIQRRNNLGTWVTAADNVTGVAKSLSGFTDGSWDFRILACNTYSWACSSYGVDGSSVTYRAIPSIPAAPSGPSTSTGSSAVSWVKPAGTVTYYDLQKRKNAGAWATAKAGDTNTSETISGLTDGSWDYRVRACNGYSWACSNYGADSSNITVRLKPSTPGSASPTTSTDTNAVTVSWTAVSTATYYNIQKRNNAGSWANVSGNFTGTSGSVGTLTDGSWDFRIKACNGYSWACSSYGVDGSQVTWRAIPTAPAAPSPTTTTDSNGVTVSWSTVSGATYYNLQKRNNGGSWVGVTGNFTGGSGSAGTLGDGSWDFRVRSCNGYSWACSAYSFDGSSVTTRTPPSTPAAANPTTSTDTNGVSVSWSAVTNATYYNVQKRVNGGSWTSVSANFTGTTGSVGTLTNGSWDFRVKACNTYSWACSSYGIDGSSVIYRVKPATPAAANPTTTTDTNGVSISWTAVSGASYYNIQKRNNAGTWTSVSGNFTGTSGSVGTLTDGSWDFRIKACNGYSWACSSYGIDGSSVTTRAIPSVPAAPSAPLNDADGLYTVNWIKPSGAVSYYDLLERQNNIGSFVNVANNTTATSKTLSGRGDGAYDYQVRACNGYDWACSGYSAISGDVAVLLVPGTPSNVTNGTQDTDGSVSISWGTSTGQVADYRLEEQKNGGVWTQVSAGTLVTSKSLSGRTDGSYLYRARACNASGCSGYQTGTSTLVVKIRPLVPAAPSGPATSTGSAAVGWSSVTNATYYDVQKRNNAGSWANAKLGDTNTSETLTSLSDGSWDYRVRACNGSWSCSSFSTDSANTTVRVVPAMPSTINTPTVANINDVTVTWTAVSGATYYNLQKRVNTGSWSSVSGNITATSKTSVGAIDGSWDYRLRACNGYSWSCSGYSVDSANVSVVNLPGVPGSLTVPASDDDKSYSINWGSASGTVTSYTLEEKAGVSGSFATVYTGASNSVQFNNKNNGIYYYQVKACNNSGCSTYQTGVTPIIANYIELWAKKATAGFSVPNASFIPASIPFHDATVGSVPGSAGVSGGSASYNIPIAVPPGLKGVQPSLSLNYSSRGGNGVAGMGWSLGGLSSVHRCGSTIAQDGYSRGVMLDAQDKLCYNGSRLRLVSGTYGLSGAQYRTEIESYQLIIQTGNVSTNSVSFEVKSNNGSSTFFGTTNDSRFIAQNLSVPTSWGISLFTDSANNSIKYTYTNFGAGEYLISSIDYTGKGGVGGNKQITFTYEAREDAQFTDYSESYLAGGLTRQTQRLSNVTTYYAGLEVLQYRLNYGNLSATTHRTLLRSVEQCAYNGSYTCLPETTFNWGDTTPQYTSAATYSPLSSPLTLKVEDYYLTGDLDGDGKSDLMLVDLNPDGTAAAGNVMVGNDGTEPHTGFPIGGFSMFASRYGDLDLNGVSEYLATSDQGVLKARVWEPTINNGVGGYTETLTNIENSDFSHGIFTNDFNADGVPDVIIDKVKANSCVYSYYGQNNLQVLDYCIHELKLYLADANDPSSYLFSNEGVIFSYQKNALDDDVSQYGKSKYRDQTNWGVNEQAINQVVDFDGNGVPDIYLMIKGTNFITPKFLMGTQDPVTNKVSYTLVEGTVFGLPGNLLANDEYSFYRLTDINADGLVDALYINLSNKWAIRLNTGGNLGAEIQVSGVNNGIGIDSFGRPVWPTMSHDYDGDGRPDMLIADITDPTKRIHEYCLLSYNVDSPSFDETYCGEDFYSGQGYNKWQGMDRSVYKWDVMQWVSDGAGGFEIRVQPTTIEAVANDAQSGDTNGDGLASIFDRRGYKPEELLDPQNGWKTFLAPIGGTAASPVVYRTENISALPDTVKSITNGLGVKSEWEYTPLAQDSVGTANTAIKFYEVEDNNDVTRPEGYFFFTSSMYVVSAFHQDHGGTINPDCINQLSHNSQCSAGMNTTRYRYVDAIYNTKGRGFQGFEKIITEDLSSGLETITRFNQVYPQSGNVEYSETRLIGEGNTTVPISESDSTYVKVELGSGYENRYSIYSQDSSSNYYGLNGRGSATLPITTSTQLVTGFDANCGNVTAQNSSQSDEYGTTTKSVVNTYICDTSSVWWPSKLTNSVVTSGKVTNRKFGFIPGDDVSNNTEKKLFTTNTWNNNYRLPVTVAIYGQEGGNNTSTLTTTSTYNPDGLPVSVSISASDVAGARVTNSSYDTNGFVASLTNPLNYQVTSITDGRWGTPTSVTDANGLTTTTVLDNFGRAIQVTAPSVGVDTVAPPSYTGFEWCTSCPVTNAIFKQSVAQAGSPNSTSYFDKMGRPIRSEQDGFVGNSAANVIVASEITYDHRGNKTDEYQPRWTGNSKYGTHYTDYDAMNRPGRRTVDQAQGGVLLSEYTYAGLTTDLVVNLTLQMSRTYNGLKQLVETVDAMTGVTRYAYDGQGNPIWIRDPQSNAIEANYDALGRKQYVDDPNQGYKSFVYNGFGELSSETDANNQTISYQYDVLGRVLTRTADGTTANWSYNNSGANIGSLISRSSSDFSESYSYDALQRPTVVTTSITGEPSLITKTYYDSNYGRPKAMEYPNGLMVSTEYDANGFAWKLKNALSGYVYNEVESLDIRGQITGEYFGDGAERVNQAYLYADETGQMLSTQLYAKYFTTDSITGQRFNLMYQHDEFGNLTERFKSFSNGVGGTVTETMTYDNLHRLKTSTVAGSVTTSTSYDYDSLGNLIYKTDFGSSYTYGAGTAGPNAVTSIYKNSVGNISYNYDAAGNMLNGDGKTLTYNSFNKPVTISENGTTLNFDYGPDLVRYKQVKTNGTGKIVKTIYLGKLFERVTTSVMGLPDKIEEKSYLSDKVIVNEVMKGSDLPYSRLSFLHKDRLGSIVSVTNDQGIETEWHAFDAFGSPKQGNLSSSGGLLRTTSTVYGLDVSDEEYATNRGFTGHEHLDDVKLIHMNGRVYDPGMGRFLSVDPLIQSPGNSQGLNPYSYIMNNPLAGTDPTGYSICGEGPQYCVGENEGGPLDPPNPKIDDPAAMQKYYGNWSAEEGDGGNGGGNPNDEIENTVISQDLLESADRSNMFNVNGNGMSDTYDNPTHELRSIEEEYGAKYTGPKDGGKIGTFKRDQLDITSKLVHIKDSTHTEVVYTRRDDVVETILPDIRGKDGKMGLPSSNSLRRTLLGNSLLDNMVDVHTITFESYLLRKTTDGTIVKFDIDFFSGEVVKGSVTVQSVYLEFDVKGFRTRRATNVETIQFIWKGSLDPRIRPKSNEELNGLQGINKYQK